MGSFSRAVRRSKKLREKVSIRLRPIESPLEKQLRKVFYEESQVPAQLKAAALIPEHAMKSLPKREKFLMRVLDYLPAIALGICIGTLAFITMCGK